MPKRFFKPRRIRTDKLTPPKGEKDFLLMPSPFALANNRVVAGTEASDYDGVADYATRGVGSLTGLNDGKQGLLSCWFRLDGGDAVSQAFCNNDNGRFRILRAGSNTITIVARNSVGTTILNIATVGTYIAGATWRHLLTSWDLAVVGARHIYITDVSDIAVTTFTNDTIDYDDNNFILGAENTGGVNKFNGCMSEIFFHTAYLDITIEANRRKFITSALKPALLGADGSIPLGVSPLLYVPDGNPAVNAGIGGNFTITGALDVCSTAPGL